MLEISFSLLSLACAAAEEGMFSLPAVAGQGEMKVGISSEVVAQAH